MLKVDILILGFALAMDAAIASFTLGAMNLHHSRSMKVGGGFYLAALFGFFQFLMLWVGSLGGFHFTFSNYGHLFQLLIAGVFFVLGFKIISDTFKDDGVNLSWGLLPTVLIAIATSLDALAAGVSLGTLPQSYLSALEIGLVTFVLCLLFYFLSLITKSIPDKWLLRGSGVVFIIMGSKVIMDYLRLGGM